MTKTQILLAQINTYKFMINALQEQGLPYKHMIRSMTSLQMKLVLLNLVG